MPPGDGFDTSTCFLSATAVRFHVRVVIGYEALQRAAKADRRGLWTAPAPMAPWDWRQQRRSTSGHKRASLWVETADAIFSLYCPASTWPSVPMGRSWTGLIARAKPFAPPFICNTSDQSFSRPTGLPTITSPPCKAGSKRASLHSSDSWLPALLLPV